MGTAGIYRLANEIIFHTTGKTLKEAANEYCVELIGKEKYKKVSLKDFTEDFFAQDGEWVLGQKTRDRTFLKTSINA